MQKRPVLRNEFRISSATADKMMTNVLLLGSGGREHNLAIALAKSPLLKTLFVAPGNPGMADIARSVLLDMSNHSAVAEFCKANHVDLAVVGPEAPLVAGIDDRVRPAQYFWPRVTRRFVRPFIGRRQARDPADTSDGR
jgi:Phosphoribosylglycinamide synthetase, N domain